MIQRAVERAKQIHWVQQNHRREDPVPPASAMIRDWLDRLRFDRVPDELARQLADALDRELRSHTRLGVERKHTLIVHVDEPALVGLLRRSYGERFSELLRTGNEVHGLRQVEFRYGTSGVSLKYA